MHNEDGLNHDRKADHQQQEAYRLGEAAAARDGGSREPWRPARRAVFHAASLR